jgi:hypothetical protein
MKRVFAVFFVGICLFSGLTSASAQTLYGAGIDFYILNPSTGAVVTDFGAIKDASNNTYFLTGLAFDSVNGILYGSTNNQSPTAPRSLVSVNPSNGQVTVIGAYNAGSGNTMADLTFDATTNTLYGGGSMTGDLYSLSIVTGAATDVGASGLTGLRGVGVAADAAGTTWGTPRGADQQLATYNKSTGAPTTVATLSGAPYSTGSPNGSDSINALAFNASGTLYGVNVNLNDAARPTHLITINTSTGAVTDVGLSVNNLDAIVFIPELGIVVLIGIGLCFVATSARRQYNARRNWR